MSVRLWSLLVWALVGAGAVFWALKLGAGSQALPAQAQLVQPHDPLRGDLARLLGGAVVAVGAPGAAAPVLDSRLTLVGVVSPPGPGNVDDAVALISIDGRPPRAYRVGDVVEGDRVLQSVSQRKAHLGPTGQPPQLSLTIPEPAEGLRGGAPMLGGDLPAADALPPAEVPPVPAASAEAAGGPVQAAAPVNGSNLPGGVAPPVQR